MKNTNNKINLNFQKGTQPIQVGFILLENFSMMAFTAAVDALVTANLVSSSTLFKYNTYGLENIKVTSDLNIDVSVDGTLNEVLFTGNCAVKVLIVCGGYRCSLSKYQPLTKLLQNADSNNITLGGLWNGAISLAYADLLVQQSCSLHPHDRYFFKTTFDQIKLSNKSFTIENNRMTSAGPSSALEMMLLFIEQIYGNSLVRSIREIISCDENLDSNEQNAKRQSDQKHFPQSLIETLDLMKANIEEPLSIDELANYTKVTRRKLERLFHNYLELPPSRYYLELRLKVAHRLVLETNESIINIAIACGFLSSTHFSHCFKNLFSMSPTQARQQP